MHIFNFQPFPTLTTDRLILRQVTSNDAPQIHYLRSDESINQFISTRTKSKSIEEAITYIEKKNLDISNNQLVYWGISLKGESQIIGTICLWNLSEELDKAELGYELFTAFQRKGIMNEAMEKVLQFGFNVLQLNRIEAFTQNNNIGSIRLLEKNNFLWDKKRKDKMNDKNMIFVLEHV